MAASTCPLEGPACVWPYSTDIPQGAGGEVCEGTPLHDSGGGGGGGLTDGETEMGGSRQPLGGPSGDDRRCIVR